jgi:hypothetical protein
MAEDGCCSGCNELNDQVPASTLQTMRILGVILIVVSVIEFGIGATAHGYRSSSTIYLGSWWTGLPALLTGICGVLNKTRGVVISMITMGAIATAVAVAGVVIDAIAATEFSHIKSCARYSYDRGGICKYKSEGKENCYCTSLKDTNCHQFEVADKYDCDQFERTLPKYVKSSAAVCSILALCSLVLVSIGFLIICQSIAKPVTKDPTGLVDNVVVGVNSNDEAF